MSVNFEERIERIDRMLAEFERIRKDYPGYLPFENITMKLQKERAELADTIGRDNVHPKQKRP